MDRCRRKQGQRGTHPEFRELACVLRHALLECAEQVKGRNSDAIQSSQINKAATFLKMAIDAASMEMLLLLAMSNIAQRYRQNE